MALSPTLWFGQLFHCPTGVRYLLKVCSLSWTLHCCYIAGRRDVQCSASVSSKIPLNLLSRGSSLWWQRGNKCPSCNDLFLLSLLGLQASLQLQQGESGENNNSKSMMYHNLRLLFSSVSALASSKVGMVLMADLRGLFQPFMIWWFYDLS